jgi:hypothetical protein
MIRTFALVLGIIGTIVAIALDDFAIGFAVYTIAVFMSGWTLSWPFAQAAMIGDMMHDDRESVMFEPFDDDEDEQ